MGRGELVVEAKQDGWKENPVKSLVWGRGGKRAEKKSGDGTEGGLKSFSRGNIHGGEIKK